MCNYARGSLKNVKREIDTPEDTKLRIYAITFVALLVAIVPPSVENYCCETPPSTVGLLFRC